MTPPNNSGDCCARPASSLRLQSPGSGADVLREVVDAVAFRTRGGALQGLTRLGGIRVPQHPPTQVVAAGSVERAPQGLPGGSRLRKRRSRLLRILSDCTARLQAGGL